MWDYIFLDFDPKTSIDDRIALADHAVAMHLKGDRERTIDTGTCAARIYTKNEFGGSGSYLGQIYRAEVETDLGVSKHAIVVLRDIPSANGDPNNN